MTISDSSVLSPTLLNLAQETSLPSLLQKSVTCLNGMFGAFHALIEGSIKFLRDAKLETRRRGAVATGFEVYFGSTTTVGTFVYQQRIVMSPA